MKIDEEKVIKSFRDYLNNSINSLSFYRESKEVVIDKFKIEGTIALTAGDYGDEFNYYVAGCANINIFLSEGSSLMAPRNFECIIKAENDEVVCIKDNRITITDKF